MEPFPITPRQFLWLWLAVAAVTFGAAALFRRAQGLPFFRPKFPDAEIQQNWRSGASSVGLLGSLAGANNCLWFALTRDTLYVGAHFPFNMFMPRFVAGLDLTIPVASISSVSEKTAMSGGGYVRVDYEVTDARGVVTTEHVDLWPRRRDHFVSILRNKVRAARR
jgi:hypothetical protein